MIAPEGVDAEALEALSAAEGLVVCESGHEGAADLRAVTEWLEARGRNAGAALRLEAGEGNLAQVLNYLTAQKYDIAPPREI